MPDEVKTLLLDLETSPNIAYSWHGKFEVNLIEFIEESNILSFAWKWLGEKEVQCKSNRLYSKDYKNNKRLIGELHKLYSQADFVVGHNLFAFDDRVANTDILLNGLPPPPAHKVIDTLKVARKFFRFNSNKLDDLAHRLGIGRKLPHTGFSMWKGCMRNDPTSWALMEKYNKHDVDPLLEGVYLKFLPWINRPKPKRMR